MMYFSTIWILFAIFVGVSTAKKFHSTHLLTACIDFWEGVHSAALASMHFDTSQCLYAESEVKAEVDRVIQIVEDEKELYGDAYNHTLLVASTTTTGGHDEYARALNVTGLVVFFIEDAIDPTEYGLDLGKVLMMQFRPDNPAGAEFLGQELCRVSPSENKNIILYFGGTPALDLRLYGTLDAYKASCPDSSYTILRSQRGDWTTETAYADFKKIFVVESTINTILVGNDHMAKGVLQAADEFLSETQLQNLLVSGFDDSAVGKELIETKRIFATVDYNEDNRRAGTWHSIPLIKDLIEEYCFNNSLDLQEHLSLNSLLIVTPVLPIAADREGYVTHRIGLTYDSNVRAVPVGGSGAVEIAIELVDVSFEQIDVPDGSFEANFWLVIEWTDKRFVWDDRQFNSTAEKHVDSIWIPDIYFKNILTSQTDRTIYQSSATISSEGKVRHARKVTGWFECEMVVAPFPYDINECEIQVSIASTQARTSLVTLEGIQNLGGEPAAYGMKFLGVTSQVDVESPLKVASPTLVYRYEIVHDPAQVVYTYMLMAWALNILSFSQFWLSVERGVVDRSGIAMGCILSNSVLMTDRIASPEYTYADLYFGVSMAFLVVSFLVTVQAASNYDSVIDHQNTRSTVLKALQFREKHLEDRHNKTFVWRKMFYFLWGTEACPVEDRYARRTICPTYFFISMIFPFIPAEGDMYILDHPESGFASPLFWLNLGVLLMYAIISLGKYMTKVYGPQDGSNKYDGEMTSDVDTAAATAVGERSNAVQFYDFANSNNDYDEPTPTPPTGTSSPPLDGGPPISKDTSRPTHTRNGSRFRRDVTADEFQL